MPARGIESTFGSRLRHSLGGDHHCIAANLLDELADDLLGKALGVNIGGVHKIAAGVNEGAKLIARLMLVGVTTPRHGPECESRYVKT